MRCFATGKASFVYLIAFFSSPDLDIYEAEGVERPGLLNQIVARAAVRQRFFEMRGRLQQRFASVLPIKRHGLCEGSRRRGDAPLVLF